MFRSIATLMVMFSFLNIAASAEETAVDFSRDIRSIISVNCLSCHGPDEETREANLRLDVRENAIGDDTDSGDRAIVPGKPDQSELIRRINSADKDVQMPPADSGYRVSEKEKKLIHDWIKAGADFEQHWAFVKPEKQTPPHISDRKLARDDLDKFVIKRLEQESLKPSPEADRYTIARRLALDLTGLPPSIELVDQFVSDQSPQAYEKYVDRLLAHPGFGERWARVWLDLARYADSQGYAQDSARTIWRYRDWLIKAINNNMPYDQFTIEQIAGDMLPEPTTDQLIATAFHRNTMTNSEGGTDNEEFRSAAVVDRVNTTMQVWMGMTMGCAQCHTHKYDPITQEEYFKFYAIFNQSEDSDSNDERPNLDTYSEEQLTQRKKIETDIVELQSKIDEMAEAMKLTKIEHPKDPLKTRYIRVQQLGKNQFLHIAELQAFVGEKNVAVAGKATQISTGFNGPPQLAIDGNTNGDFKKQMSTTHTAEEVNPWWEVDLQSPQLIDKINLWNRSDGSGDRLNNWRVVMYDESRNPIWIFASRKTPDPNIEIKTAKTGEEIKPETKKLLANYDEISVGTAEQKQLKQLKANLANIKPTRTPIMRELPKGKQRVTKIQLRGNFKITSDEVSAGVPEVFHGIPEGSDVNRASLARWLVDRENPLTARVVVNRYWEQLFGYGIVETVEDFGTQGELPSHQDLLDYLAIEFMDHNWDTKWLIKKIVSSSTYRQSSRETPEMVRLDPRNRLLARGPRFRLPAEMIRDQALAISGLLSEKMYGPSVRPPQPKLGLRAAFGQSTDWNPSPGEDRLRRGLYTSWRRTTPYPSMMTFDAPSREVCTIRRIRTNTPLQALVTLNDPVYVEASQALGRLAITQGGTDDLARLAFAFRKTLIRKPKANELSVLNRTLQKLREQYEADDVKAMQLATSPIGSLPEGMKASEAAAWTVIGNILLNLDETLARP